MEFLLVFLLAVVALALLVIKQRGRLGDNEKAINFPYQRKEVLLTPAERSFLGVLEQAVGEQYRIYAQVRLADLMVVKAGLDKSSRATAQNRINGKHADFVLCERDTIRVVAAIELDDLSHQRDDRQKRDDFLNEACRAANLPLVRFSAKAAYSVRQVREDVACAVGGLEGPESSSERGEYRAPVVGLTELLNESMPASGVVEPVCPRCGGETVIRSVKAGPHAGKRLWGCKQYPSCKGYVAIG
ncbi:MAG: protein of unknown function, and zinc finger-containing [Moraxellaceae bacterium]|jgi:very-short-patch-repair endonuclease|nr:protein of unknown function, and zinc finger-containing [Moraxellaceae bacterium]